MLYYLCILLTGTAAALFFVDTTIARTFLKRRIIPPEGYAALWASIGYTFASSLCVLAGVAMLVALPASEHEKGYALFIVALLFVAAMVVTVRNCINFLAREFDGGLN